MAEIRVNFTTTGVFGKIADNMDKRIICLYGGSSSSKTISALQYLTMYGMASPTPLVLSVIGESVPVIRRSVYTDWVRVVMQEMYESDRYNKVENTYHFPNGSILQFIPADDEMRFHAMRHDIVLIDEAYNIPKGVFDQVEIRTRKQLLLTWNPVSPFWATHLDDTRDDVAVIHSTYKDNPHISKNIAEALERRSRTDANFYRVYVLGEYGSIEGLVFRENENWFKTDTFPTEYKRRIICIDYGFTHDPTAIIDLRYADGQFYAHEIEYKPGMFNRDIAEVVRSTGAGSAVADSAEPKSNAELRQMKINVYPSIKGPDSVRHGIGEMKQFRINITRTSANLIKEFRNYSWEKNRQGEYTDKPKDGYNHGIDAIRYGVTHIRQKPNLGEYAIS